MLQTTYRAISDVVRELQNGEVVLDKNFLLNLRLKRLKNQCYKNRHQRQNSVKAGTPYYRKRIEMIPHQSKEHDEG